MNLVSQSKATLHTKMEQNDILLLLSSFGSLVYGVLICILGKKDDNSNQ